MQTLFDIAGECRHLSDKELIYNITNSESSVYEFDRKIQQSEPVSLEELFSALMPARRKVAVAAVEMYKRLREREVSRKRVMCSQDIYELMKPHLCDLETEEFWVLALNQCMNVVKRIRLSAGGIDGTYVDVRVVLKQLLLCNATNFAVVHNHPSGNTRPSNEDKTLTGRLQKAATTMNLSMTDHVIVCDGAFYSFADEGLI